MSRIFLILAFCVAAAAPAAPAVAEYYHVSGDVYRDGYGAYFKRSRYKVTRRYCRYSHCSGSCSRCYTVAEYRYKWTPYSPPQVTVYKEAKAAAQINYSPNWKTEAVKALESLADLQQFNEVSRLLASKVPRLGQTDPALGFSAEPAGGGAAFGYAAGYVPNAITAQSAYGFPSRSGYNTIGAAAPVYPVGAEERADLQTAARVSQSMNELAGSASGRLMDFLAQRQDGRRELAKYERDAAIAAIVGEMSRLVSDIATQPESHTQQVTPVAPAPVRPTAPAAPAAPGGMFSAENIAATLREATGIVSQRCAGCHSGADSTAGLDLTNWAALSLDDKKAVKVAVETGRMPVDADGNPKPLEAAEVDVLQNATIMAAAAGR